MDDNFVETLRLYFSDLLDSPWMNFYLYFIIVLFSIYTILFVLATRPIIRRYSEWALEDVYGILKSDSLPPISFLVPAFNESKDIVCTVRTLLKLSYRYKQIIVINDGSTDAMLDLLIQEFSLVNVPPSYPGKIVTQPIRGYYLSEIFPNLLVIDKINGGKADALNAGLNACVTPVYISSDADTLIDDKALIHLIRPFLEKSETIVVHGSVCIANGCKIADNRILEYRFPKKLLVGFQVIEYLRGFYLDRMGFNWSQGALIVPGAFGMFKTEIIHEIGGYDESSIAEDMEIIMRVHKYMLDADRKYHIEFIPDPVAWTEAPDTLEVLRRQRRRWYTGTTQCMWIYRCMFFNPKYKSIGLVVYPYYVIDKVISPLVEASGYILFTIGLLIGKDTLYVFLVLGLICWAFATFLTLACILVEEMTFRKYPDTKEMLRMIKCALLENLTYHFISLIWKLRGLIVPKHMKKLWHVTKRKGYDKI